MIRYFGFMQSISVHSSFFRFIVFICEFYFLYKSTIISFFLSSRESKIFSKILCHLKFVSCINLFDMIFNVNEMRYFLWCCMLIVFQSGWHREIKDPIVLLVLDVLLSTRVIVNHSQRITFESHGTSIIHITFAWCSVLPQLLLLADANETVCLIQRVAVAKSTTLLQSTKANNLDKFSLCWVSLHW